MTGELTPHGGEILIYQTESGRTKIDVRLEGETLWLSQAGLADLYQTSIPNVNIHIKNIYDEEELSPGSTIKDFLIVRSEGSRKVGRQLKHYNLDMIISVGYRIKSPQQRVFASGLRSVSGSISLRVLSSTMRGLRIPTSRLIILRNCCAGFRISGHPSGDFIRRSLISMRPVSITIPPQRPVSSFSRLFRTNYIGLLPEKRLRK